MLTLTALTLASTLALAPAPAAPTTPANPPSASLSNQIHARAQNRLEHMTQEASQRLYRIAAQKALDNGLRNSTALLERELGVYAGTRVALSRDQASRPLTGSN